MQPPGGRARHGERLLLPDDPASAQGQRIEECGGSIRGAKVLGIHDLERGRADPADRREGPGEVQGADPGIDASDARGQSTAAHRAVGAILGRLARLLRLLPDAHRAARTGLMDSSPITHVYLATVEERAASVRAIAPPGSVPLPRGRRGRGRVWVLAHGSPCDSTAGLVQRVLRLDRPSSIGGIANRLTRSNRRGTDPYARWCGRGGAARLPPIPILQRRGATLQGTGGHAPGLPQRTFPFSERMENVARIVEIGKAGSASAGAFELYPFPQPGAVVPDHRLERRDSGEFLRPWDALARLHP